jgi:chromosome segregation ATPase
MAVDNSQSEESDLDRTDRLPILEGVEFADDVEDDAVRLEYTDLLPSIKSAFPLPSSVDLPSLAESVRSVEERIARQTAEYEALSRSYNKLREAEAAGAARAHGLSGELVRLQAILEAEQKRLADTEKALLERIAAAESSRGRIEEALREAERFQSESHTLRDTLGARDSTIAQVLHSLGERDAQLLALQREHAQVVPALEERLKSGSQLEAELRTARGRSEALAVELRNALQSGAGLGARLKQGEAELDATRQELAVMKSQASAYLEQLRTREWRRGFDQNLFRELDAEIGTAEQGRGQLQGERDRLRQRVSEVESRLAARDEAIAKLQAAATAEHGLREKMEGDLQVAERTRAKLVEKVAALENEQIQLHDVVAAQRDSIGQLKGAAAEDAALRATQEHELQDLDGARAGLMSRIAALESEQARLQAGLAAKDLAIDEALLAGINESERIKDLLSAADEARSALSAEVERLHAEARARDQEIAILTGQLQDARGPIQVIEAEVARLTAELQAKTASFDALTEDNRNLRASVERARGALEEREFLIRRLERSESNSANVLGRIQTSIERLGIPSAPATIGEGGSTAAHAASSVGAAHPVECTAELARVDGSHNTAHALARRTRIGRAPGCELQIDSTSVSRHHALVLMGQRDVIIEDLNSTNGVLVNGRKISRQLLNDGDMVTIGEAQFRFKLSFAPRVVEPPAAPET